MAFVLDASVAAVWAMRDEDHPIADAAMLQLDLEPALVPAIWWYEVRNILVINERRKRISEMDATRFIRDLGDFPIHCESTADHSDLANLARRYQLTVYDAAYLDVALRHGIAMASLDKALRSAAKAVGVPLLG